MTELMLPNATTFPAGVPVIYKTLGTALPVLRSGSGDQLHLGTFIFWNITTLDQETLQKRDTDALEAKAASLWRGIREDMHTVLWSLYEKFRGDHPDQQPVLVILARNPWSIEPVDATDQGTFELPHHGDHDFLVPKDPVTAVKPGVHGSMAQSILCPAFVPLGFFGETKDQRDRVLKRADLAFSFKNICA